MANVVIQKLKPVLKPIRNGYLNVRQSIVGTPVQPMNYVHAASRSLAMSVFAPAEIKQSNDERAETLRQDGYISMPGVYDPGLIREIREGFSKIVENDALVDVQRYTRIIKSNVKLEEHIPRIFELVRHPQIMKVLHSFYKSYFQLIYVAGTRLIPLPEKERTPENLQSGVWHCDDLPTDLVHLAVYLHDVTPEHGPTCLVSKQRTRELMRMGYCNRWEIGVPQSALEDPRYVRNLASKAGTAHLMLPCLILHRAGVPQEGLIRDSLFFSFRPGLEPVHIQNLKPAQRTMYGLLRGMGNSKHNQQAAPLRERSVIYVS
jgi:hypothetical protein